MAAWFYLLLVPLVTLIAIFLLDKNNKSSKKYPDPPGPPRLPLIGNLHQFDSGNPQEYLMKLSHKYGALISLKLGTLPVLVISTAEMAREALRNHDIAFSGRPALVCSQKLSYNGLDVGFSPYGEYWREMRKVTVLHLLSLKKVQSFRPILEDEIAQLMDRILASGPDQLIDVKSTIVSLTNGIICRIAFGNKGDKEGEHRRSAHQILHDTEALLGGFFISDYFPSLRWIDKLRGMLGRLEKNFQELDSFYQELIEEHLDHKMPKSLENNILHLLIQLKEEQSSTVELTWDHIKAMLTNIFIAATDSTAATIIWALTSLMKNPSTMKRLQTEIRDFFKNKTKIDSEQLRDLPYLNAVIKETLRLQMPVPLLLPRQTIEACTVGGYQIKPQTFVLINAWAIARDPKTWEDPNEFKPERFLTKHGDLDVIKGQHFELIPFGSGRRGCPGANLAIATVELVLANLLNNFDWELPSGMNIQDIDLESLPGVTTLPKNPIRLRAKRLA